MKKISFSAVMTILSMFALGCAGEDIDASGDDRGDAASDKRHRRPKPKACGSRGMAACGEGEFCAFEPEAQCGAADRPGVCTKLPPNGSAACPRVFKPVCGCDGKTYSNACVARSTGTSVSSEGACERACGGLTGLTCEEGEFCKFSLEAQCGAADQTGVCAVPSEICAQMYAPVCGCDDKTYPNECEAHSAGVSVASKGRCEASTQK